MGGEARNVVGIVPYFKNFVMPLFETVAPILGALGSTLLSSGSARARADRANKYNSPVEQIKRLREAGISPSMFYAGGRATAPAVVEDAPNVDPDLGVSAGLAAGQNVRQVNVREKLAQNEMRMQEVQIQGAELKNRLLGQQVDRFNADRELDNYLRTLMVNSSVQSRAIQDSISESRLKVQQRAQALAEERFGFDVESFVAEQNLKERVFGLQEAKTKDEMRLAQMNYTLDAARYLIQTNQLKITQSQLEMAWKKYENDYALSEAINEAFDGNVDWQSIMKAGFKNVPRAVVSGIRRLVFGR